MTLVTVQFLQTALLPVAPYIMQSHDLHPSVYYEHKSINGNRW